MSVGYSLGARPGNYGASAMADSFGKAAYYNPHLAQLERFPSIISSALDILPGVGGKMIWQALKSVRYNPALRARYYE